MAWVFTYPITLTADADGGFIFLLNGGEKYPDTVKRLAKIKPEELAAA